MDLGLVLIREVSSFEGCPIFAILFHCQEQNKGNV